MVVRAGFERLVFPGPWDALMRGGEAQYFDYFEFVEYSEALVF